MSISELLPCMSTIEMIINYTVWALTHEYDWYQQRLQRIEDEVLRLYCIATEDVIRP